MTYIDKFTEKYFFLSNFFMCPIVYEDILYPSAEHAYQAAKTLDIAHRLKISKLETAGQAKREGNSESLVLRADWEQVKDKVMYDVCKLKFANPKLKKAHLNTKDAHLIEGNTWHDNYWGVCRCGNCPKDKRQPVEKQNHLGKILMQIREESKLEI